MTTIRIAWRAGKLLPCPLCRGNHSCSSTDAGLHFCWRTHHDVPGWRYVGDSKNGFGMFFEEGAAEPFRGHARRSPAASRATPSISPGLSSEKLSEHLRQHLACADDRRVMGEILGVSPGVLLRLRVGYVPETEDEKEHWLFPERDASGRVIGLLRRYLSGVKRQLLGSHRGIVFDPDRPPGDVVLVVEGPSDVAAAMTMGLSAIGKPSNLGGSEYLAQLLEPHVRRGVEVLVLGENDHRPERGLWPGRDGARQTAQDLAKAWGVPVAWSLPPEGVKDLRTWMWESRPDVRNLAGCADLGRRILSDAITRRTTVNPCPDCLAGSGDPEPAPPNASVVTDMSDLLCINIEGGMGEETAHLREDRTNAPGPLGEADSLGDAVREVISAGMVPRPCPRHFTPLLQSRKNPRVGRVVRADCRTHACHACGPRRHSRWLLHLMCLFDDCPTLHLWRGEVGKPLDALKREIRRRKANYVCLSTAGDAAVVVADRLVVGASAVSAAHAANAVASALQRLAQVRLPVSTSRDWAMYEYKSQGDYLRRGAAPRGRFDQVVQRLRRANLEPVVREGDRGARCDWFFPGEWPEERVDLYYELLAATPPDAGCAGGGSTPE